MPKPRQKQSLVKRVLQSLVKREASLKAKPRQKHYEDVISLDAWKDKALLEAKLRHPSNQKPL